MRILVTALYVSGDVREGGSSRFMRCVANNLASMGHEVVLSNQPGKHANDHFDLIICSHVLQEIKNNPAHKIYISQGILVGEEWPSKGANRYIAISEEIRKFNMEKFGVDSEVIGQPIEIGEAKQPNEELKNILIIRRHPIEGKDPFVFLSEKYNVRISDFGIPIEEQIDWADLCITLGRGALESMAQGKPVIVADKRPYMGAIGDGYVTSKNISDIAKSNFSGRCYKTPITRKWLERELAKYNSEDSRFVYDYVFQNHDAKKIVKQYLLKNSKIAFGCLVNDIQRLDMVLSKSEIDPMITCHTIKNPESATKGLNKLLDIMREEGDEIAILVHQDMYFRNGWVAQVKAQIEKLPDSWVVAGTIGKDMQGRICGKFQDMRIPLRFDTSDIHDFPQPACCFDECCIIVNLKKDFRFDETLDGFDLYGTLCVLQVWEIGETAWILGAFAEHYCMRPFTWVPSRVFKRNYKWLHKRFKEYQKKNLKGKMIRLDSTAIGLPREEARLETSAA